MLLATLIPGADGITNINKQTTYGGGIIPFAKDRPGLAFTEVLHDPDAPYNRNTYERCVILITGGFAD